MNYFILDHETHNVNQTIRVLGKRKDVDACQFAGEYHEDRTYCQVYIATTMTEGQLDHWLWSTKSVGDYVGLTETEDRELFGIEQYIPEHLPE